MHILLTCNFSPWSAYSGGGQRSTHQLASTLAKRGHRVTVIFTKATFERVEAPTNLPYTLRWASFPDVSSRRQAPLRPLSAISVAALVAHAVRHEGVTVVHANGEEAACLPALKRVLPFTLVVTSRYPNLPEVLLREPADRDLPALLRLALAETKYVTLGIALRGADWCSPPSFFAGEMLIRAYGLDPARMKPVHNGVPAEFLEYIHTPEPEPTALFFGRLEIAKGTDTLLDALAQLGDRAPRTLMVGRGPERARIVERIQSLGLQSRVELHEWADHHTLGKLLSRVSLAVLPSFEENFSLAVLSVMAVGTPLVSTRVGGTPEVLEHERNGLMIEAGDVNALATSIQRLLDNPAWATQLGQAGRKTVREHFTWNDTARKFEALYSDAR